ncbi:Gfo/Idh/MocA family protein [Photobacterium profundum]|uniref:Oxidoreductase n=1 Tax=Photobacterium profundum 3TCK TaxID=314280 RepID=Q1Z879_9GAMM|nr:Gfo/Idh/MocA family oxidoreductase [Photobacterium profundum]EAS44601.1 oxidoreductase [Photobacterium profundum 3TCK]EAS44634.1 oxidoreductase [Photobacterium profundum 3TCK]
MNKVAVIGLGNIANRHRRNLKMLFPDAELLAMSASGRVPREAVSDCDGIVASVEALINAQVELVIVASPAPFHAQHAIPLIEAGIPTLIEKPVTTTMEDVQAIQRAIEQYQTPVAVGYCLRYLPSALQLKVQLDAGKIGTLYNSHIEIGQYLPDWRPNKDYRDCVSANKLLGGGALFELSHELDYAQWLLGPLNLQHAVLRSSKELDLDVEDMVDILALTDSGAVTTIHLDFLQRKAHRQCSFVGSQGRIDWDLIQNQLILTTATETTVLYSDPEWDKNQMYLAMIDDFVQMIGQNQQTCTELLEAATTVRFIDEVKQQANMT